MSIIPDPTVSAYFNQSKNTTNAGHILVTNPRRQITKTFESVLCNFIIRSVSYSHYLPAHASATGGRPWGAFHCRNTMGGVQTCGLRGKFRICVHFCSKGDNWAYRYQQIFLN